MSEVDKIYVDHDSAKTGVLRELERLSCDELTRKVKELEDIVTSIEGNWKGANSNKYRKQISEIIDAISKFKNECLEPNIESLNAQLDVYKKHEELG